MARVNRTYVRDRLDQECNKINARLGEETRKEKNAIVREALDKVPVDKTIKAHIRANMKKYKGITNKINKLRAQLSAIDKDNEGTLKDLRKTWPWVHWTISEEKEELSLDVYEYGFEYGQTYHYSVTEEQKMPKALKGRLESIEKEHQQRAQEVYSIRTDFLDRLMMGDATMEEFKELLLSLKAL